MPCILYPHFSPSPPPPQHNYNPPLPHPPLLPTQHNTCLPSQPHSQWILPPSKPDLPPIQPRPRSISRCNAQDDHDENDLADLVHDFIENGSCDQDHRLYDASDSDAAASALPNACERLQAVTANIASTDREIASIVTAIALGANELDLFCPIDASDCNGNCIRRLAVKHLRMSGYNASICRSKWQNTGKVPGGEYEYVDICQEGDNLLKERVIIDLDFRSQLEIARPSQHYQAALRLVPLVFVGKSTKLEQILQIMSEEAKCSLKQNAMHLPPWRTLAYMRAKWLSPYERNGVDLRTENLQHLQGVNWRNYYQASCSTEESQCREQLRRLKAALKVEVENGLVLKPILNGRRNITRVRRGTW